MFKRICGSLEKSDEKLGELTGFTLMEVLVALAILSGTLIVVSQSWSGNFLRVRKSDLYHNVALLLESKMSEMTAKYTGVPLEQIKESEKGDFGDDFKRYRWEFKSQEFKMPDLTSLVVKDAGPQGADQMLLTMVRSMNDYISQSVKEGTVTVFVKGRGKKEISYSLTTYFIDYNRELPLGGI